MVAGLTIAQLEEEAARRITALDASRFEVAVPNPQGFHESREPLTANESTAGNSHLSFSASVEDAPASDDDSGNPSLGWASVDCILVVVFLYKLPATSRTTALRLATEAARAIAGALLASWPEVTVRLVNRYKPGPINNDGFLPVELRFIVQTDEPLWAP